MIETLSLLAGNSTRAWARDFLWQLCAYPGHTLQWCRFAPLQKLCQNHCFYIIICLQTEALSSMAFVPAQNLFGIQCGVNIALVTALKWDILENKATVKTFRSPIHWPFSILESPIVHSVCSSSPPPPTFCMKDAQYLISVRKLTIF